MGFKSGEHACGKGCAKKCCDQDGGRDKTETCLTDSPQSMYVCRGFLIAIFPHDKDNDEG